MIFGSVLEIQPEGLCWKILDGVSGWVESGFLDVSAAGSYLRAKNVYWKIQADI